MTGNSANSADKPLTIERFVAAKKIVKHKHRTRHTSAIDQTYGQNVKAFHLYPLLLDSPQEENCLFIIERNDDKYQVIIGNHELTTDDIRVAERHLYHRLYLPLADK